MTRIEGIESGFGRFDSIRTGTVNGRGAEGRTARPGTKNRVRVPVSPPRGAFFASARKGMNGERRASAYRRAGTGGTVGSARKGARVWTERRCTIASLWEVRVVRSL